MTEDENIKDCLEWFAKRDHKFLLWDFSRPIGRPCKKCGYPLGPDKRFYPLKTIECPEHKPTHWKHHGAK